MDHYATLGLKRNASLDEIKKAYRQLAKKWHPDKNGGSLEAEDNFKKISDSYTILSDPIKKKQYDDRSNQSFKHGFDDFVNGFSGTQFNDWQKRKYLIPILYSLAQSRRSSMMIDRISPLNMDLMTLLMASRAHNLTIGKKETVIELKSSKGELLELIEHQNIWT